MSKKDFVRLVNKQYSFISSFVIATQTIWTIYNANHFSLGFKHKECKEYELITLLLPFTLISFFATSEAHKTKVRMKNERDRSEIFLKELKRWEIHIRIHIYTCLTYEIYIYVCAHARATRLHFLFNLFYVWYFIWFCVPSRIFFRHWLAKFVNILILNKFQNLNLIVNLYKKGILAEHECEYSIITKLINSHKLIYWTLARTWYSNDAFTDCTQYSP